jgi:hypothetical protein
MKQICVEWGESVDNPNEIDLDPETTESFVALMAQAMVAVVRAIEEVDDER